MRASRLKSLFFFFFKLFHPHNNQQENDSQHKEVNITEPWQGQMVLTQFLNRFNFIFADSVAAVVVKVLPPLKVLTLNAVPESREAYLYRVHYHQLFCSTVLSLLIMTQFLWWNTAWDWRKQSSGCKCLTCCCCILKHLWVCVWVQFVLILECGNILVEDKLI